MTTHIFIKKHLRLLFFLYLLPFYSHSSDNLRVDLTKPDEVIAKKLAPIIYFHPNEKYFPTSMEEFIQNSLLYNEQGNIIGRNMQTIEDLIKASKNEKFEYLDVRNSFRTGSPNWKNAPIYVRKIEGEEFIEYSYNVLFAFNGCQIFRIKTVKRRTGKKNKKKVRNFEWCNFARHEGDIEHITVRIKKNSGLVLGAFFSAHGAQDWIPAKKLSWSGTHLIAYSALNTHAFYKNRTTVVTAPFDLIDKDWSAILHIGGLNVKWLRAVDTTETKDLVGFSGNKTNRWNTRRNIVLLDSNTPIVKGYQGKWGKRFIDNRKIKNPTGNIPYVKDSKLKKLAKNLMKKIKKMTKAVNKKDPAAKFKVGNAPGGIWRKKHWKGSGGSQH